MWLLPISIIVFTIVLAIPLSRYMAWIMDGKLQAARLFCGGSRSGWIAAPQNWKQYTARC